MATPLRQTSESQLKSALTAAKEKRREATFLQANAALLSQQLTYRRAVEQVLRPFLAKAGLDVEKLEKMAVQNQSELRRIFQNNKAEAAQRASLKMAAIRERFQQRARVLQNHANLSVVPFTTMTLEPIFIWQTNVDSFRGSQIEPNNSWVKFLMEASSGSQSTDFRFVFLWENQRDDIAVVNVASSLVLNGVCQAIAAPGFFSGDTSEVNLSISLTLLGLWQADPQNPELPPPMPAFQQSQYQALPGVTATGSGIFGSGIDVKSEIFSASSYDLGYDLFLIAPQSSAAFEVSLDVGLKVPSGGIDDSAVADFADNDLGYELMCPGLQLDLLTAPQTAS
jgi:hypothetical protein